MGGGPFHMMHIVSLERPHAYSVGPSRIFNGRKMTFPGRSQVISNESVGLGLQPVRKR